MLSAVELCAGAGGLSLGLEQAGFKPEALVDSDTHCCATLRLNRPEWNTIEADLKTFDLSLWKDVDLLSGGLPCPTYSLAGQQRGADDERDLFPKMLEIVDQIKPRAILIENVRGLMSAKFEGVRNRVSQTLEKTNFRTYWAMLNAADYATPQNRHSVFLIALRNDVSKELTWPFAIGKKPITVGQSIGDLMSEQGWKNAAPWIQQADRVAPTIVGGSKKTWRSRSWTDSRKKGMGRAGC